MGNPQSVTVVFGGLEQITLRTDSALKRHDNFLADRINRGIGHLGKELLEVVVQHPRLIAQAGKRRIVSHGADRVT